MSATKSKKKATKKVETKAKAPKAPKAGEKKPKKTSALDAAAQILAKSGKPMRCQEMVVAMSEAGLWKSPQGKTPSATLYSAVLREIATKGKEARFKKIDRGQFEFRGA